MELRARLIRARAYLHHRQRDKADEEIRLALALVAEKLHRMNTYAVRARRKKGAKPSTARHAPKS